MYESIGAESVNGQNNECEEVEDVTDGNVTHNHTARFAEIRASNSPAPQINSDEIAQFSQAVEPAGLDYETVCDEGISAAVTPGKAII